MMQLFYRQRCSGAGGRVGHGYWQRALSVRQNRGRRALRARTHPSKPGSCLLRSFSYWQPV